MALKPCRECKEMVSTGAKTCPHCGVSSPTGMPNAPGAGCLIAVVGILVLFAIGWIMEPHPSTEPAASSDSQGAAPAQHEKPIDFSRPIYTKKGAPFCATRDGLKELLQHLNAGIHDIAQGEYGCIATPDGFEVTVLDTEGILDMWAKVTWHRQNGTRGDFWTVIRMLRN